MNNNREFFKSGELKNKFTDEVRSDGYQTWRTWHELVTWKLLPVTFDINISDFISMILVWQKGNSMDFSIIETIETEYGPGGGMVIYSYDKEDYYWQADLIGWSNNTTTLIALEPWLPEPPEEERDSGKPGGKNYDKLDVSTIIACEMIENFFTYFRETEPPPWFSMELVQGIQKKNLKSKAYLEEILKDDPPRWLDIASLAIDGLRDYDIGKRLGIEPSSVATRLSEIRAAHPELEMALRRIAKPKRIPESEKDVKIVKKIG